MDELVKKISDKLKENKIRFTINSEIEEYTLYELLMGSHPVYIQLEDIDCMTYFMRYDEDTVYDIFNEGIYDVIYDTYIDEMIYDIKERYYNYSTVINKVISKIEDINSICEEYEIENFIVDNLWDKFRDS